MRLIAEIVEPQGVWRFALLDAQGRLSQHGSATAALLPRASQTTVVLPPNWGAWHPAQLPKVDSSRRQAALIGAVEERLLTPAEISHVAWWPQSASGHGAGWAYACDRGQIEQALEDLKAHGHRMDRVVPGAWPLTAGTPQIHLSGDADSPTVACTGSGAPWTLPAVVALHAGMLAIDEQTTITAEPQAARWAEERLSRQPTIVQPAQRLMQLVQDAALLPDIAQHNLAHFTASGWLQSARRMLRELAFDRRWQPLRWAAAALLLVQLAGINWLAHHQRSSLAQKRAMANNLVTQTYPEVTVVLDAAAQMSRQLQLQRMRSGVLQAGDLEYALGSVAGSGPAGAGLTSIQFSSGEAALTDVAIPADSAKAALASLGLSLRVDGPTWRLVAKGAATTGVKP